MTLRPIHHVATWLLIFALLAPMSAFAAPGAIPPTPVANFLTRLAASEPDDTVSIIVQKQGASKVAEQLVENGGGTITHQFPMINAFVATVPARMIPQLQQSSAVRQVSLNAPVQSQNAALANGVNASDEFNTISYTGSDGAMPWLAPWQEIGEADGAEQGDIGVTAFWGGALQGLRLQGSNKGVVRSLDLSTAEQAQVQVAYRRKSFLAATDYVALQLSTNGQTWTEVARWSGPTTDGAMQYGSYDIAAYRAAQTSLRFVTSATMSDETRFYIDSITVTFAPTWADGTQSANKVYLPLIEAEKNATAAVAPLTKAERLAHLRAAAEGCDDYCINLDQVASSYVKAIRADQLWNVAPYPRGAGVRVAVVDSGISPHPDLNDGLGYTRVITHVNFVANSPVPDDYFGHGTHIAGTIAGAGQSSDGAYMGVAPEAELIDIKVMDDWGRSNTSDIIAGLQWIYNHQIEYGIGVVNLSLNSTIPQSYQESPLDAAIEVLWFNKIVVVVSAGNGGTQKLYPPANDPFVITVGAFDDKGNVDAADDTLAPFSAYGMTGDGFLKPDLVAPGTHIVAPLAGDDNNLAWAHPENKVPTALYSNKYYQMSGTSMAAAVVSGAVALLLEDEPTLTPDQIKYRLQATAHPVSSSESCGTGAGGLDIQAAVNGLTTASANTGIPASQMLWTGATPLNWSSVNWSSVNWSSVNWSSVNWSSVNWSSVNWNSANWSSVNWSSVNWNSANTSTTNSSGSCTAAFQKFILVNADTGSDIQSLYNGAVINPDLIGTRNLTVRAETVGAVGSVTFALNNNSYLHTDHTAPYTLTATDQGSATLDLLTNGRHKLRMTTYSNSDGSGNSGAVQELEVLIASGNRCELEGSVHAQNTNVPVRFQILNNTAVPLELFWLNTTGQRQSYGTIAPGATHVQTTYATHPWLIARDSDDACLRLIPDAGTESTVVVDTLFTGTYQLAAQHSNKCLDLANTSSADGVAVQQSTCNTSATQQWRLELVDNGAYRLISTYSEKALEVVEATLTNGANVQQVTYAGLSNQQWRIEPVGDGSYWLIAVHSGKALTVAESGLSDGTVITQWSNTGSSNQKWHLLPSN